MTKYHTLTKATTKLITTAGALALMVGFNPAFTQTAYADDCLLDTNDDGFGNVGDTDGGASSGGFDMRLACGVGAMATGNDSTALGHSASAGGVESTAVGQGASAGSSSTALGRDANAGQEGTALGHSANAAGISSTALGISAIAAGNFATALGRNASAPGDRSIAVGYRVNSGVISGPASIALGYRSRSAGINAIAIGSDTGEGNFTGANAAGNDSIVVGADASDGAFAGAIVMGFGATATEADQVILKDADTFTILGNGDLGVGTAAPSSDLHVVDTDTGDSVKISLENTTDGSEWQLVNRGVDGEFALNDNGTPGAEFIFTGPTNQVNGNTSLSLRNNTAGANWQLVTRGVDGEFALNDNRVAGAEFIFRGPGSGNPGLTMSGTLTTGGGTCGGGCDVVFDADYDLPSIEDHAREMYAKRHLPNVGPTPEGAPINVSDKLGRMLNELEKAHIYIAELNAEKQALAARVDQHKTEMSQVMARLAALENKQ